MDLLTVIGVIVAVAFVLLVIMLIVVVLGAGDEDIEAVSTIPGGECPHCGRTLIADGPHSYIKGHDGYGLLRCPRCGICFKRYRMGDGLTEPMEVFGTPIDVESEYPFIPRDEKEGGDHD